MIAQDQTGNGAAQTGPYQGADAVTAGSGLVTSRPRVCKANAFPVRAPGSPVGQGRRGFETRDRKVRRVSVDPAMASDGLNELVDDDDDMQGPWHWEMALYARMVQGWCCDGLIL